MQARLLEEGFLAHCDVWRGGRNNETIGRKGGGREIRRVWEEVHDGRLWPDREIGGPVEWDRPVMQEAENAIDVPEEAGQIGRAHV